MRVPLSHRGNFKRFQLGTRVYTLYAAVFMNARERTPARQLEDDLWRQVMEYNLYQQLARVFTACLIYHTHTAHKGLTHVGRCSHFISTIFFVGRGEKGLPSVQLCPLSEHNLESREVA